MSFIYLEIYYVQIWNPSNKMSCQYSGRTHYSQEKVFRFKSQPSFALFSAKVRLQVKVNWVNGANTFKMPFILPSPDSLVLQGIKNAFNNIFCYI